MVEEIFQCLKAPADAPHAAITNRFDGGSVAFSRLPAPDVR
jgi:hypothetical protein